MALTNERAEMIAKFLVDDKERANSLFELSPADATAKINSEGYDFSVEEITEFGLQLKTAAERMQDSELNEESLSEVAGGVVVEGVAIACISLGYAIGSALAKNYGW